MPSSASPSSSSLSEAVYDRFVARLPQQHGRVAAEYIWVGGTGQDLRSKTRTLEARPASAAELPEWNFDGSSTGQAPGDDSEVVLRPRAVFADPFLGGDNVLVLCDCHTPAGEPVASNTRAACAARMEAAAAHEPWFGIEQEYTLFEPDGVTPLGWPKGGFPGPQGPYYCGVGAENAFGRHVKDAHYKACLHAGVRLSGTNGEVMPGQWEYQVGPCVGIEAGDHTVVARYIMQRVCEQFGVICSIHPKPIRGDWNGAGCHTNYSTKAMRAAGGMAAIEAAVARLARKHAEHMTAYGEDNEQRMTGRHETASYDTFSHGVADRGASIRIPRQTERDGRGYFEDRRPSSNMDPYVVTGLMVQTTVLDTD